ncbi:MAG: tripartite tricarboxylate transporter substrate binding protein [Betaproteobacteria bacterium]|jgi:tripartite-type tricarboxylate transporter receptor subunit TctC
MKLKSITLLVGLYFCALSLFAQNSDGKLITLIVPTTSGTGSDIAARLMAPRLSKRTGSPVVVENKTGASGIIAISFVANAQADGNTILIAPNTMAMIKALNKNLPFDPINDFATVARLGKMLVAIAVNPEVPVTSIAQLIEYSKSRPNELNYGTPGSGTPHHLRTEMFKQMTGANLVHVPYKGSAGAVTDLVGGQVQMGFFPLHSLLQMVNSGKLRMLATSGDSRSIWTPNIPTFKESGIKDLNDYDWLGAYLPKNTNTEVVKRLSREIVAIFSSAEMQDELSKKGIIANPGSSDDLLQLMKRESSEWKKIVDTGNIASD